MCKQIISKHHTQRACRRMYRIQTYRYFHSFWKVDRVSVCKINTKPFLKSRATVWKTILNHKVLWLLCIDKWCDISFLSGNDRLHIFNTKFFQICCDLLTWTRCDLVNHRPRKCYGLFIADISQEVCVNKSFFLPFFRHGKYRLSQFFTISGTIIHRYQCQRIFSCLISFKKHSHQHCHCTVCPLRTILNICLYIWKPCSICFLECISLFCNCKRYHL